MIELKSVTKQYLYGGRLLGALDLTINDGEITAVLGGAGSGKTTLLKVAAGATDCEGEVLYNGEKVSLKGGKSAPENDGTFMLFDDLALFDNKTVYGNLYYPLKIRGVKKNEANEIIYKAALQSGAMPVLYSRVKNLSLSDKKRAAFARLFIRHIDTVIIDGLTDGLTEAEADEIRSDFFPYLFDKKREGATVLFSTSRIEEAMAIADKIVVLHAGAVKQIGLYEGIYSKPENIWAAEAVDKYYNVMKGDLSRKNGTLTIDTVVCGKNVELGASCLNGRVLESYIGKTVLIGLHSEDFSDLENCAFAEEVTYAIRDGNGFINYTACGLTVRTGKAVETVCVLPDVSKITLFDESNESSIMTK